MTDPDRAYSALLERVYQAALEPSEWPSVLALAADWLNASRALLFTPGVGLGDGGFFYSHGVSAEEMTIWSSRYVGRDFWTSRVIERKLGFEGSVILDRDLSSRRELLESEYYREHLVRMQIAWLLGSIVLAPPDGSLPMVGCSMYQGPDASGFDEGSRRKMALLLPHLSRAFGVMFRLREADVRAASGAAALDALRFGVAMLDSHGNVVQSNLEAERIWRAGDGLSCVGAKVRIASATIERTWQLALRATLADVGIRRVAHFSERLRVPKASGEGAYLMQMSRVPEMSRFGALHGDGRVIVFITDEDRDTAPAADVLIRMYALTPAEARCAQALGGDRLATVATRLGLSPHTVKTQLKRVYAKTGCASRADLTRLLLSLATVS